MPTRLLLAALASAVLIHSANAQSIIVSDDAAQSGFSGDVFGPPPPTPGGATAPINAESDPFTFSGIQGFTSIESISITLTIFDGNTGPGEADENALTLALDGIDTGIRLNGFLGGDEITLTITGTPINGAAILAALADGQLNARIFDSTGTALLNQNDLTVPAADINGVPYFTTLSITAVPEPGTVGLIGTGVLLALASQLRRFRRKS
jgi:hypothetical protein